MSEAPVEFVETYEFWWPVAVRLPADGGTTVEQCFEARFTLAEDAAFLSGPEAEDRSALERERATLAKHVTDVRGIDHPTLSGPKLVWAMLDRTIYRSALMRAFVDANLGKAREGN